MGNYTCGFSCFAFYQVRLEVSYSECLSFSVLVFEMQLLQSRIHKGEKLI
uniref:Uncharacterized protein n=1 Tax=Anguilla anguilla TaxID=7936 RepID=A0A0E9RN44_ANGAN